MEVTIKEAFNVCFKEITTNWLDKVGVRPQAPYRESRSPKELFVLDTLNKYDKGYAEWRPVIQEKELDFSIIESKLGFIINEQIKAYLNTYWFMPLSGKINNIDISLSPIKPDMNMQDYIIDRFNSSDTHYLRDDKYFMIASYCCINGNDSYLVQVNNRTGEITAVEVQDEISVKIADNIIDLLTNLKGEWL